MISLIRVVILYSLIVSSASLFADDDPKEVKAMKNGMPKEIALFISRLVECNHWGSEEPYDFERSEQIRKATGKLRCGQLDSDEKRLRWKYLNNPKVIERIDKAKSLAL